MKTNEVVSISFIILVTFCSWVGAGFAEAEEKIVDNLQYSRVGQFPKDWETYPFQKNKAHRVYKVLDDNGHKYIQAMDSQDISVPIFKDFNWDLKKYPYLKFRWRAHQLPEGAREVHWDTNDSACGVYVGFSRSSALKYVWSTSLPPGSFWAKNPGKFSIISKTAGKSHLGQWVEITVHVAKDYLWNFEKPLEKNPIGIGIMTDGNAVHQPSACDYADFRISTTP